MLMTYRSDDGTETEQVWNSRDGVTPFVITLRSGKQATHADWQHDRRMPEDWTPPPGMRVFADLTERRARVLAGMVVDRWLADPDTAARILARYGTREAAAAMLLEDMTGRPGEPDLIDPQDDDT